MDKENMVFIPNGALFCLKKYKLEAFLGKWMHLLNIILNQIDQTQNKNHKCFLQWKTQNLYNLSIISVSKSIYIYIIYTYIYGEIKREKYKVDK